MSYQQIPGPAAPRYPVQPQQLYPQPPMKRRGWVPWAVSGGTFLVGIAIGAAGGDGMAPAAGPQPTATVTATATATATAAGPAPAAKTVRVPGAVTTKTVTAAPPGPKAAITDDGIYLVGKDIMPGTYRSGNDGDCYWARLRDLDGDLNSIVTNGLGPNQTVRIRASDKAFKTSSCGSWTPVR